MKIAIVGLGALMPGSTDVAGFWRTIVEGRDLIRDVPATHWLIDDYYDPDPQAVDKTYARRGAFLDPVDFDPLAFGIPPRSLPATDTSQLLALLVAQQVLADVGGGDRERVGVVLGTSVLELATSMAGRTQRPIWLKAMREGGIEESLAQAVCERIADHYVPWQEATFPGLLANVVAGRVANRFDLHGVNCTIDAACASSLAAVSYAIDELALGHADMMITGGVDNLQDAFMFMCFSKTPALSPTGDCRPFSDTADGTILGEGLAMFALKRLEDAERDGNHIYAVIRGIGASSDGRSTAIYAPLPEGQSRALRRAYESAGYAPGTVELVEAHGTGTRAGDAAEFAALREVFADGRAQRCALGSVKSQLGHTKSAAGAASLLKAALALHHRVLPPTIKVERPNPELDLPGSPFYLNTRARPWIHSADHPRRAAVSSFGFGGSNFHLTLEEYGGPGAPRVNTWPSEVVLVSAPSPDELLARLEGQPVFHHDDHARIAFVASDAADRSAKLARAADVVSGRVASLPGIHYQTGASPGKVAFLFSGQGSQYTGMGADLAMQVPEALAVWDRAATGGVHEVVFPIPAFTEEERQAQQDRLTATEWAQPALAVQSMALLAVLDALGVVADCVAGHSFGELVALHAAGVLDADSLVRLARRRGELMRDAAQTPGAMLAVSCPADDLTELCGDELFLANHNAPEQTVLAGTVEAVGAAQVELARRGVIARRLNTATGFHSPLVAGAAKPLLEFLRELDLAAPRLTVYGNADAQPYPADPDQIRQRLADHLTSPVRFRDEIEAMYERGVRVFIEVGAGSVLSGLTGQILGEREHLAVSLDRAGANGLDALNEALARLSAFGVAIGYGALRADEAPRPAAARSGVAVQLLGTNYGKPYPPAGGTLALPPPREEKPMSIDPAPPDSGWWSLLQETQRQTADAHATYQRLMAETHMAFLRMAEASIAELAGRESAPPRPMIPAPPPVAALPRMPAPPPPPKVPAVRDLEGLLLDIVADKTGYPVEMLNAEMELEADLGIDSIKRVEILSTLRDRAPDLPHVEASELGALRTLGAILERLATAAAPKAEARPPGR